MKKRKHDWASLQSYLNAHERVLKTFAPFMDYPRQYQQTWVTENYLQLQCVGIVFTTYAGNKVRIDISKDVEIDNSNPKRLRARTTMYSYNANTPRGGNIIRYDSPDSMPHDGRGPDHHFFHHKHSWDSGSEQIHFIADDAWPHVDEFLREILTHY